MVAALEGRARIIAINDAYLIAPFADINYFADFGWWQWHSEGRPKPALGLSAVDVALRFRKFRGQKCTIEPTGLSVADPEVFMLHKYGSEGLSPQPNALVTGLNSGFQSINLAVLAGARRILLYGYDMRLPAAGPSHWFGDHPTGRGPDPSIYASTFKTMLPDLARLGVDVVNCTPGSALKAFRMSTLEAELA